MPKKSNVPKGMTRTPAFEALTAKIIRLKPYFIKAGWPYKPVVLAGLLVESFVAGTAEIKSSIAQNRGLWIPPKKEEKKKGFSDWREFLKEYGILSFVCDKYEKPIYSPGGRIADVIDRIRIENGLTVASTAYVDQKIAGLQEQIDMLRDAIIEDKIPPNTPEKKRYYSKTDNLITLIRDGRA